MTDTQCNMGMELIFHAARRLAIHAWDAQGCEGIDCIHANWVSIATRVDGSYTASQFFDLENRPTAAQGGHGLLNARLGGRLRAARPAWICGCGISAILFTPSIMRASKALRFSGRLLIDVLPDLGDHNGAFAHCRGHPLDRPGPYVADSKNAGVGCRERRSR